MKELKVLKIAKKLMDIGMMVYVGNPNKNKNAIYMII
jgi:hypothetical protein